MMGVRIWDVMEESVGLGGPGTLVTWQISYSVRLLSTLEAGPWIDMGRMDLES